MCAAPFTVRQVIDVVTTDDLIGRLAVNRRARERKLEATRAELKAIRDTLKDDVPLSPEQARRVSSLAAERDSLIGDIEQFDAREEELLREKNLEDANRRMEEEIRAGGGNAGATGVYNVGGAYTSGPAPYHRGNSREVSFFRDLRSARFGDADAADRLRHNEQDNQLSRRGWDSSAAGAGGTFAPPGWLVEDWVAATRAARVTADLVHREALPPGISSVNLPRISTGSTVAVQQTQNSTITETTVTTTSVSSGIVTVAGGQTLSVQMLEQSGTPIDQVVMADLAAAYAVAFDTQVLSGSGANGQLRGIFTATFSTSVTYTTTQPAVVSTTTSASFYYQVTNAAGAIAQNRYAAADCIVMHPRRWTWVLNALDGDGRPLVVPTPNVNAPGAAGAPAAQGYAGELAGLPVYLDPSIPTTLGTATNQDAVIVMRRDDLWLWESSLRLQSFDAPKADSASVYFRALGFSAFIPDRNPASVVVIGGTGLVAPS